MSKNREKVRHFSDPKENLFVKVHREGLEGFFFFFSNGGYGFWRREKNLCCQSEINRSFLTASASQAVGEGLDPPLKNFQNLLCGSWLSTLLTSSSFARFMESWKQLLQLLLLRDFNTFQWRSWAQLGALARIELLPHPASHLSSIVY